MTGIGLWAMLACGNINTSTASDTTAPTEDSTDSDARTDTAETSPRNAVVILVDTLRADHLQAWGYSPQNSAVLSDWIQEGVRFEQALSPNAWTVPVVGSLWTGLYPSAHGLLAYDPAERIQDDELVEALTTLPELFQAAGFTTAGLVKSPIVKTERGHGQGFDLLEAIPGTVDHGTSGQELTDAALDWLQLDERQDQPFFLYLHYMEPHTHYIAPEPFYDAFDTDKESTLTGTHGEVKAFLDGDVEATDADKQRLKALYDGEIAYLDSQLERLFSFLEESGRNQDTVVVLMGDHGEQFGEHGGWLHGDLYQENIHVPLVLRVPGLTPRVVPGWVQSIDVTATLAGLFDLGSVDAWHSRDLGEALQGGTVPDEIVYFEYANERGVVRPDGWKFFHDAGSPHLFNLQADPGETEDLIEVEQALAEELSAITEAFHDQALSVREELVR